MNLTAKGGDCDQALSNLWSLVKSHYQSIRENNSWVDLLSPAERVYFEIYKAKRSDKDVVDALAAIHDEQLEIADDELYKIHIALGEYCLRAPYPEYPLLPLLEE